MEATSVTDDSFSPKYWRSVKKNKSGGSLWLVEWTDHCVTGWGGVGGE